MTQATARMLEVDQVGDSVTRAGLWEAVTAGLRGLVEDDESLGRAGEPVRTAAVCGNAVGEWARRRVVLEDGEPVDRVLVGAVLEAACTSLEFSGEPPARVAEARRRFEDLSLGSLAPPAPGENDR